MSKLPLDLEKLPPDLDIRDASFYSPWAIVSNVEEGISHEHRYVIFDYDSNSGDTAHADTITALKSQSPRSPETSLSRASGLRLERVGDWVLAHEPNKHVYNRSAVLDELMNLLRYARDFPQNR